METFKTILILILLIIIFINFFDFNKTEDNSYIESSEKEINNQLLEIDSIYNSKENNKKLYKKELKNIIDKRTEITRRKKNKIKLSMLEKDQDTLIKKLLYTDSLQNVIIHDLKAINKRKNIVITEQKEIIKLTTKNNKKKKNKEIIKKGFFALGGFLLGNLLYLINN